MYPQLEALPHSPSNHCMAKQRGPPRKHKQMCCNTEAPCLKGLLQSRHPVLRVCSAPCIQPGLHMPKHLLLAHCQRLSPLQWHPLLHCPGTMLKHCLLRWTYCQSSWLPSSHRPLATPLMTSLRAPSPRVLCLLSLILMLWRSAVLHHPASELPWP